MPNPIPNIQDILLNIEGFTCDISLYFNISYYNIILTPNVRDIGTNILPWGKFEYCRLTMGISGAPDIFQEITS